MRSAQRLRMPAAWPARCALIFSMGAKIIASKLGRFHRACPDVMLDMVIDDALSDIVAGRFDAGIRVGERLQKDMIAVRLTPEVQMLAVASPEYLARRGEPKTPADLHGHDCINWRFPGSGNIYRWPLEKRGRSADAQGHVLELCLHPGGHDLRPVDVVRAWRELAAIKGW